jgi:hypothetical protein
MLVIPFGRKLLRKKEVATGVALPPRKRHPINNKPIPPDYAMVTVTWTHNDDDEEEEEEEEIDIPTEEGKGTSEVFLA